MIVYICMLLISILFLYLASKTSKKGKKIICYVMAILPFFAVSAIRYDIGTDYLNRYDGDYRKIGNGIDVYNLEIGFKLLIKFCNLITPKSYILFAITSAIIVGFIMYRIIKNSNDPILGVLIFFLGGFYFESLNILRQYLAMSIIVFAYPFLLEKKKIPLFILCTIIAGLLHSSAFVMLILLLLKDKMVVSWKWVIPAATIILILNENLLKILALFLTNTRFSIYLTGKFAKGDIPFLYVFENLIMYIFMFYVYTKLKNRKQQDALFLNIQALALLTTVMGSCHMLFLRSASYFSIFQVVSVPYYVSQFPVDEFINDLKKIKIDLTKYKGKIVQYIEIALICFMFVCFFRTNILNNTNEPLPYKTIFNKNVQIK